MWISLDNLKPWMILFSPSVQIGPAPQRLMLYRVPLDEHLVLWSLARDAVSDSNETPDDRGFAPNVDLCLLVFIFLAFPLALSFPCLPSHPESATCDFWERTGASGAWAWDYTPTLPFCYRTVAHLHVLLSPLLPAQEIFV